MCTESEVKMMWKDQPQRLVDTVQLGSAPIGKGQRIEVRKDPQKQVYFLTVGNLFGSQTAELPTPEKTVLLLLSIMRGQEEINPKDFGGVLL